VPKRVLDGDAMWTSTKLSECPEWSIPFYAWIYPLADANGSFELTNMRVIWSKVAPILPTFTPDTLAELVRIFRERGLLFVWDENGKRYGHWVGSEKKGRLPQPARRTARYGPLLAPPVPSQQLQEFELRQRKCRIATAAASPVLVLVSDLDWSGRKTGEDKSSSSLEKPDDDSALQSDCESIQSKIERRMQEAKANLLRKGYSADLADAAVEFIEERSDHSGSIPSSANYFVVAVDAAMANPRDRAEIIKRAERRARVMPSESELKRRAADLERDPETSRRLKEILETIPRAALASGSG